LNTAHESERIAKVIARAGLCSRREAERWILDGRVSVNGKTLDSPAFTVGPDDRILVDGKPLPASEAPRLFLYHKPVGLVTTARDEKNRPTVFAHLPPGLPRVVSVGRLDLNSEGLLLLTNDGGLARYLELPANAWKRRYRVRVHGAVKPAQLAKLAQGITVEGVKYGPMEARMERAQTGANVWLVVTLQEGKNREIRKVMAELGLQVSRLIRTAYGPFALGDLPPGSAGEVAPEILKNKLAGYFAQG
jgi:23S rRNA pseudouridine2605 synthase